MRWLTGAAVVLALIVAAVIYYHQWQHWLAYATGSYNCPDHGCPAGSPHNYNAFSGALSDVAEITIPVSVLGLMATMLRKNNCEVHGCWRLGRHGTAAGHRVCRKHHPDDKLTHADVIAAHAAAAPQSAGAELRSGGLPGFTDAIRDEVRRHGGGMR